MKTVVLGVVAVLAMGLGGCRKGLIVEGKVLVGEVPFVLVVDRTDPRYTGQGEPGVTVTGRVNPSAASGESLGEVVSDRKGAFWFRVREQTAVARPIEFRATGDGFMPTVGEIPSPPSGNRAVLILVKRATP